MNVPDPFEPTEPDEATQEMIRSVVDGLTDSARKIGLYMEQVGVMTRPDQPELGGLANEAAFRATVENGGVVVVGLFAIGDVAWEKRTLDPEQDEIDQVARVQLPTEVEVLKEKLRRAQEEGRDPFSEDL